LAIIKIANYHDGLIEAEPLNGHMGLKVAYLRRALKMCKYYTEEMKTKQFLKIFN